MTNSRPSARQLSAFYEALQAAEQAACRIPSHQELQVRRDAYLASLR